MEIRWRGGAGSKENTRSEPNGVKNSGKSDIYLLLTYTTGITEALSY